jgi:Fe-S-cluster-containing dehydrogenase component/CRP-like cAMP-binding protein
MASFETIQRPERWTVPFSEEMTEEDVDELLRVEPFRSIDPSKFRGKFTLRGILKNDTRIVNYKSGEIIVRQGDWGNSAFLVVSGKVRADLESPNALSQENDLSQEILGRQPTKRKGIFQILAQLWSNSTDPEVRDVASYRGDSRLGTRGDGHNTRIYLQDVSAVLDKYRTALIEEGQFFGEIAALGRCARQATVFAETDCQLVEIRWQGLRDLKRRDEAIDQHIDQVFRDRALRWFLLKTAIFDHLDEQDIEQLVHEAEFESHGQYDWSGSFKRLAKQGVESNLEHEPLIASEGDHPNGVIIVRGGLARLSQRHQDGHKTVGYLTPGQIYGLEEMVAGWNSGQPQPLENTLRAIGIATVIVIPTRLIEELLLRKMSKSQLESRFLRNRKAARSDSNVETKTIGGGFMEFIVQNRYINGTATMLIDMERCTRCDDCVRACAATHDNNPRFLRSGPIQNNIMVANACMHCEDPVCMIECPTGAIQRDLLEGQIVINDHTCIGCSACANNCPYSAIRMVEVRDKNGDFIRDETKHAPIVKATKCDLCVDQWGGPACQNACPHDALVRMDMRDGTWLTEWLNR